MTTTNIKHEITVDSELNFIDSVTLEPVEEYKIWFNPAKGEYQYRKQFMPKTRK